MAQIKDIDFIPERKTKRLLTQIIDLRSVLPSKIAVEYCDRLILHCLKKGANPRDSAGKPLVDFLKMIKAIKYPHPPTIDEMKPLINIALHLQNYYKDNSLKIYKNIDAKDIPLSNKVLDFLLPKFVESNIDAKDIKLREPKTYAEFFSLKMAIDLVVIILRIDVLFSNCMAWKLRNLNKGLTQKKDAIIKLTNNIIKTYETIEKLLTSEGVDDDGDSFQEKIIALLNTTISLLDKLNASIEQAISFEFSSFFRVQSKALDYGYYMKNKLDDEISNQISYKSYHTFNQLYSSKSLIALLLYLDRQALKSPQDIEMPKLQDSQSGLKQLAINLVRKLPEDLELQSMSNKKP